MEKAGTTPDALPWIPPGKPKNGSKNKFAHKKGSLASKINEEVRKKRSTISNKSKNSTHIRRSHSSSNILSLSDSGRGTPTISDSERKDLQGKIVEIFEEDELDNPREHKLRRSLSDSGIESRDTSHLQRRDSRDGYDTNSDEDDSLTVSQRQVFIKRNKELNTKVQDYMRKNGKFRDMNVQTPLDVRALTPNTAEMHGYHSMRQELDQNQRGNIRTPRSRDSVSYFDRNEGQYLNQSFSSFDVSPRIRQRDSNQGYDEFQRIRQRDSNQENPEAWLILQDGHSPRNRNGWVNNQPGQSSNYGGQPRYKLSVQDSYHSPRRQQVGRISRNIPVNFANSVGSVLKTSFANLNTVRETPVETFRSDDTDILIKQNNENRCPSWLWILLLCVGAVLLIGLVIAALYFIISSQGNTSSQIVAAVDPGPGDNAPCVDYVALTEKWRRLIGRGPSQTGERYECDRNFKDGWYRFDGEAGERLADQTSPPSWEDCGTSRVGWLSGSHPEMSDGTVNRTLCVTAFNGNCELKMPNGQVRACPNPLGGIYYVYYLVNARIGCNWGYCALGSPS